MLGIFIALLYNFYSNKNTNNTSDIPTSTITRTAKNSGTNYFISSKDKNLKLENLTITNNSVDFILNIENFDNLNIDNNIITVFVNNVQVYFDFNDKINNKKYEFAIKPNSNCFNLKINNLNVNKKENDLLIIISKKCSNYDMTSSYEERQSNSTNFFNLKLFNYNSKNNGDSKKEYQHLDSEKDIKMNNGIYLNQWLNNNKKDINPFIKSKTNQKIDIPVIIKNDSKYNESNIMLLVNDEQYKVANKDYINIKLNNSLAKFIFLCVEAPNQKGNYNIKVAMKCKNKGNQIYFISNTIKLIVE
ncbi:hypothetical protein [Clostridium sp. FP1]|uniref:hypothetical protein n=1 Tax=Clostridium sp. FP1 TaxID=2724076 RepID=UPI001CCC84A9|nr:hypothetical protein [Clostridium sp. FP1]MBZ9637242.1 hypothetical protein [Clostridium sp. FP1]